MKKNIIISGCSMSSDVTSLDKNQKENSENHNYLHWPHFLDSTNKNFYVINASRDGADNGTIFRNLKHIFKHINPIMITRGANNTPYKSCFVAVV